VFIDYYLFGWWSSKCHAYYIGTTIKWQQFTSHVAVILKLILGWLRLYTIYAWIYVFVLKYYSFLSRYRWGGKSYFSKINIKLFISLYNVIILLTSMPKSKHYKYNISSLFHLQSFYHKMIICIYGICCFEVYRFHMPQSSMMF